MVGMEWRNFNEYGVGFSIFEHPVVRLILNFFLNSKRFMETIPNCKWLRRLTLRSASDEKDGFNMTSARIAKIAKSLKDLEELEVIYMMDSGYVLIR
jgi:hypothetical protein